jgi:hypothetical protein
MYNEVTLDDYYYLLNNTLEKDWFENVKKILIKYFEILHIYKFLTFVFAHKKSTIYIKTDKKLANACFERCKVAIKQLYSFYLQDAPLELRNCINDRSIKNNLSGQVDMFRYILINFKNHELIGEFKSLIHYYSILNFICKQ